jgi:hypothetical protein
MMVARNGRRMMNTVDELIKKLQAISDAGFGSASVMLEGCDCTNDWDGSDLYEFKNPTNGNTVTVEICCTI